MTNLNDISKLEETPHEWKQDGSENLIRKFLQISVATFWLSRTGVNLLYQTAHNFDVSLHSSTIPFFKRPAISFAWKPYSFKTLTVCWPILGRGRLSFMPGVLDNTGAGAGICLPLAESCRKMCVSLLCRLRCASSLSKTGCTQASFFSNIWHHSSRDFVLKISWNVCCILDGSSNCFTLLESRLSPVV